MHCTHCGTTLKADDRFCPRCGASTTSTPPGICPTCHAPVPVGAAFCPACGADVRSGTATPFLPAGTPGPAPVAPPPAAPNGSFWGKVALGGLGGLLAGQLLGGGGGLFGGRGWGDRDDRGDWDGGGEGGFDGEG